VTKSTGVGRGGQRQGAGRKPKVEVAEPTSDADVAEIMTMSPEQIMERGMHVVAVCGRWDDASKIAARLAALQARKAQPPKAQGGKKETTQASAQSLAGGGGGRFAVPAAPVIRQH
jgi:hypothetical protein